MRRFVALACALFALAAAPAASATPNVSLGNVIDVF